MDRGKLQIARRLHERPLSTNERYWLEVIRLASHDSDPPPTLALTQAMRRVFETGGNQDDNPTTGEPERWAGKGIR